MFPARATAPIRPPLKVKISPQEIVSNVGVCTILDTKRDGDSYSPARRMQVRQRAADGRPHLHAAAGPDRQLRRSRQHLQGDPAPLPELSRLRLSSRRRHGMNRLQSLARRTRERTMSYYQGLQAEVGAVSRPQWRSGRGLLRAADARGKISRRRRHPSHPGLVRVDHRSRAQAGASRLCGDLAASLFPRRQPGRKPRRSRRAHPRGRRRRRRAGHGRRGRRDGLFARAAECDRQDRRHRLLLRRPPHLSRRLHAAGHRRRGRLLGRQRHRRQSRRISTTSVRSRRSI